MQNTKQNQPQKGQSKQSQPKEAKVDEAIKETFPASDPPSMGKPTATEPPVAPTSRKAPIIRKEDVEAAQRGEGHNE